MEIQSMLEEAARNAAREDLVVMAVDVRTIKEGLAIDFTETMWRLQFSRATGTRLRSFCLLLKTRRLEREIKELESLYTWIMKVAKMTGSADIYELRAELRALRAVTRSDICLNCPRLPWSIRSRIDDASIHLM